MDNNTNFDLEVDPIAEDRVYNAISKLSYTRDDILRALRSERRPLEKFVLTKNFSLTWLVEKIFRNNSGLPLRLLPFQSILLDILWNHKYPMILASRGAGKSFIYGLYALMRAFLVPGSQVCIVGAGFRQSKLVFSYISKLYYSSPIIFEALQSGGGPKMAVDQCHLKVGRSNIFAIPLGDGGGIRGIRANVILCDEFASIPEDIFEIVIQPFAAVHSDPERQVMITELLNKLIKFNAPEFILKMVEKQLGFGNQVCISGTAFYEFNHFYRKYEMYRKIIFSGGDDQIIAQAFSEGNRHLTAQGKIDKKLLKSFKYTDYAIVQLPYHALPAGFMDDSVIANAKLTYDPSRFGMEYLCRFAKDSDGFYKRSLIEGATPKEDDHRVIIELYGEPGAQYVMGIDPARHNDNLAISIIKLTARGKEIVYVWSVHNKPFDVVIEKLRDLMKRFNIIYIAMDQGGGGSHIADLLSVKSYLRDGEEAIWNMNDDETKHNPGKRILDMFQWNNEWNREANYAMKGEIYNGSLLFPFRPDEHECFKQYMRWARKAKLTENEKQQIIDELYGEFNEDDTKSTFGVWDDICETINEMCAIVIKVSENGQETFVLPSLSQQQKTASATDARHRDRYSATLLAAYAGRVIRGTGHIKTDLPKMNPNSFKPHGGFKRGSGGVVYPVF